jgi:Protein of unknown function (DUF3137)
MTKPTPPAQRPSMPNPFDDALIMPGPETRAKAEAAVADYNAYRPASQMAVYRNIGLVLVPGGLLFAWIVWLIVTSGGGKNSPQAFLLTGMILALIWGAPKLWQWAWQPATEAQQRARDRIIPQVFGFVENLRYRHGFTPDFMRAMPAKSILRFTRIQHDDMITGVHDGVAFSLAECEFWLHEGKSETKEFQGAVFHCKAPTSFPGLLLVSKKLSSRARFWRGGPDDNHIPEIFPDDGAVERVHSVRSDNPAAAKALVNGNLGGALRRLDRAFADGVPRLILSKDDIFLMVPSEKNFFELPGIGVEVDYKAHVEPIVRELAMLLATVALVRKAVAGEDLDMQ